MPEAATAEPETMERTIILPRGVKPWKAASCDDYPNIAHGYLSRREDGLWLVTTDSYIACAIRVEGDAEEGLVSRGALKWMHRGGHGTQLDESSWRVDRRGGHRVFSLRHLEDDAVSRYRTKVLACLESYGLFGALDSDYQTNVVGLDPRLLNRLALAMGVTHGPDGGVRLQLVGAEKAIRVTNAAFQDRVGVQMPIRLGAL